MTRSTSSAAHAAGAAPGEHEHTTADSLTGNAAGQVLAGHDGAPSAVHITSSDPNTALTLKPARGTSPSIGDITIQGSARQVTATGITLRGDITASGVVQTLRLGDITGDRTLAINGTDPRALLTLQAGRVADVSLHSALPIKTLSVLDWQDTGGIPDAIIAPSISAMTSKADFGADVTLTDAAASQALGKLTVAGTLLNAKIVSAGAVGAVTLGAMNGSQLLVGVAQGVTGLAPDAASFVFQPAKPSLGSMTIKGLVGGPPSLLASIINAWNIGKTTLKLVDSAGAGEPFGVAAGVIGVLRFQAAGLNTGKPVTLKSLDTPDDLGDPAKNPSAVIFPVGQFTLQVV